MVFLSLNGRALARWRSLLGLLLLLGYGLSSAEVVLGELRDGEVHHESAAAALDHTQSSQGEHGHEDPGSNPQHGSEHEHGTSGDHCTHTHSAGLLTHLDFTLVAGTVSTLESATLIRSDTSVGSLFHPPRA